MPSTNEIKSMAKKVSEMKNDLKSESSSCNGQVDHSSTWWKGEAATSFRNGYKEIRTDLNTLMNKMEKLYTSTEKLSAKVQRAMDERKAAAAALALAEQKKLAAARAK